jgi:motility/secretion related protein SprA
MKFLLSILLLLLLFSVQLSAFVYVPEYYMKGCPAIVENQIDVYKIYKISTSGSIATILLSNIIIDTEQEVLYERKRIRFTVLVNGRKLYPPVSLSFETYRENVLKRTFYKSLEQIYQQTIQDKEKTSGEGLIPEIVIDLPNIALPRSVRKFMGNKAGRLNLDGSQKLTFAGSSTSTDIPGSEGDNNQNFDLQMKQDLNLRLKGTIGEKIHVSVNHSSSSEDTFLSEPNDINISYKGFEDEVIKSIEGGNIALSLTGSRFISYSASSEGLFGIKSEMEFGELKITSIFGKDEAKKSTKKYKGNTQSDSTNIKSKDFVNRTQYFIDDPDELYELYTQADSGSAGFYSGFANNAVKTDASGAWLIKSPQLLPDIGSLEVYIDDNQAYNNYDTITGTDLQGISEFQFDLLIEGSGYTMDYDSGILKINQTVGTNYTIGVIYTRSGQMVGSKDSAPIQVKLLREANQNSGGPYWDLQVRNIYSLGMENIKSEGFEVDIYTLGSDNTRNYYSEDGILYNEYLRLDINQDGFVNGEDATIDLNAGYIIFPFIKPFNALGDEVIYIDETPAYDEYSIWIGVKGKIGREQINLNQMNILQGSVVIKLTTVTGTTTLTENIDYLVDYDFGNITILDAEAKDTDNELDISYQFKPLFAIDSKTLMGIRADMNITDNIKVGGTFIFQSEKISDDRPKIGNENRSIMLADLDGEIEVETPFLTTLVDWIPLVKTDEESSMTLSGEVAVSVPQIYGSDKQSDKNEAYIDDMESILDTYPLGVARRTWVQASKPYENNFGRARINWYNPDNIKARDIYDPGTLSSDEEDEKVSVLACKIYPSDLGNPGIDNKYWSGIMKYIGNQVDLSEKKYLEFLVKVDSLPGNINPEPVIMHIDIGDIDEDYYVDFGGEGILNTEDGLTGNFPDGSLDFGEDLGLDGISNGDPGDDPNDRYSNDEENIDGEIEYPEINGTENNGYLDTEDLDGNGYLNSTNVYYEYSVVLNSPTSEYLTSEYNDWKLFRIPLDDAENYRIISDIPGTDPDLEEISFARIWFEVEETARIKIVSADMVGNKWEETGIRDSDDDQILAEDEYMIAGIIDNQKNPNYTSAPGTVIKKDNEVTLEQSLIIDYENINSGHIGLVRQRFQEGSNQNKGLNMLSYDEIRFWVYTQTADPALNDSLIIRIGADSLNYYEIATPLDPQPPTGKMLKEGWQAINIKFSDLTHLKALSDSDITYLTTIEGIDYRFSKVRAPTLSNVKEIRLGIKAMDNFSGRLYFDDIRVANPYEEIGFAARTDFHTTFADFSTLDINLNWKTPNFQSSGNRSKTITYIENTSFDISSKFFLNKFFPAGWGFNIPLNLSRKYSLGIPLFKSNSDILREDLSEADKEREQNKTLDYAASINLSMNKTPGNKILEYTLKNSSLSGSISHKKTLTATNADTSFSYTAKHTYNLDVPKENVDLRLWGDYHFYFLPNTFDNTLNYKASFPNKWRWDTYSDSVGQWVPQTNTNNSKTLDTDSYIKYDLFSDMVTSYKLVTNRDLLVDSELFGLPLGKEKKRTQTITLDYDPNYTDRLFSLNTGLNIKYKDEHKKQSSTSEEEYLYYGDTSRDITVGVTLKNKDLLTSLAGLLGVKPEDLKSGKEMSGKDDSSPPQNKQMPGKGMSPDDNKGFNENKGNDNRDDNVVKGISNGITDLPTTGIEPPPEGKDDSVEKPEEDETGEESSEESGEGEETADEEMEDGPGFNPLKSFVTYLARIDNFKINFTNDYTTSFEKRIDRPEFAYQLGIPHSLSNLEIKRKTDNNKITVNSGFPILNTLTTSWSYSYENKKSYENPAENYGNQTVNTVFPNVSATLTSFEKLIKADKILTSSRLSTSYSYSVEKRGVIDWEEPTTVKTIISMQPLISWNGNWVHNITTSLSLNYYQSQNVTDNGDFDSVTDESRQNASSNFSWTFSADRGIKLPFMKKKIVIKNEMTADLGVTVEKSYSTRQGTSSKVVERDMFKYSITPGASYKFSNNIRGGLSSNYELTDNRKNHQTIKTFRLSLWVEIIF